MANQNSLEWFRTVFKMSDRQLRELSEEENQQFSEMMGWFCENDKTKLTIEQLEFVIAFLPETPYENKEQQIADCEEILKQKFSEQP